MALPRKLKNMNIFANGLSYIGQATSVTVPKLTRKMEDYRGAGMNAPVKIDMGMEGLVLEFSCGGFMVDALAAFGATRHDATQLRFVGSYQRDDTGDVDAVEITVRGRYSEIDMGDAKPGDDTEHKFKAELSFYRLEVAGREVMLIDIPNMVEIIDGIDRLAQQRAAIGA
jgi:P2 family phage contractile tail tube protein